MEHTAKPKPKEIPRFNSIGNTRPRTITQLRERLEHNLVKFLRSTESVCNQEVKRCFKVVLTSDVAEEQEQIDFRLDQDFSQNWPKIETCLQRLLHVMELSIFDFWDNIEEILRSSAQKLKNEIQTISILPSMGSQFLGTDPIKFKQDTRQYLLNKLQESHFKLENSWLNLDGEPTVVICLEPDALFVCEDLEPTAEENELIKEIETNLPNSLLTPDEGGNLSLTVSPIDLLQENMDECDLATKWESGIIAVTSLTTSKSAKNITFFKLGETQCLKKSVLFEFNQKKQEIDQQKNREKPDKKKDHQKPAEQEEEEEPLVLSAIKKQPDLSFIVLVTAIGKGNQCKLRLSYLYEQDELKEQLACRARYRKILCELTIEYQHGKNLKTKLSNDGCVLMIMVPNAKTIFVYPSPTDRALEYSVYEPHVDPSWQGNRDLLTDPEAEFFQLSKFELKPAKRQPTIKPKTLETTELSESNSLDYLLTVGTKKGQFQYGLLKFLLSPAKSKIKMSEFLQKHVEFEEPDLDWTVIGTHRLPQMRVTVGTALYPTGGKLRLINFQFEYTADNSVAWRNSDERCSFRKVIPCHMPMVGSAQIHIKKPPKQLGALPIGGTAFILLDNGLLFCFEYSINVGPPLKFVIRQPSRAVRLLAPHIQSSNFKWRLICSLLPDTTQEQLGSREKKSNTRTRLLVEARHGSHMMLGSINVG